MILRWTFGNRKCTYSRHGLENFPRIADADGVSVDIASLAPLSASMLALYLSLLSSERLAEAQARENNRVYNTAVVVWLMITQRLQAEGTLETAVLELPGLPAS